MKDPWLFALALAAMLTSGSQAPPGASLEQAVNSLTVAIAANDVETVDRILSDDWEIIDATGSMIDKERFVGAVRSGELVHEAMALDETRVRIVGDSTLWIARARGSGRYRGARFTFDERSTSLWEMRSGRWTCLFTQLTAIAPQH
jgi:ketosteroid isomerase-like protein